jgi:hypothetical protein
MKAQSGQCFLTMKNSGLGQMKAVSQNRPQRKGGLGRARPGYSEMQKNPAPVPGSSPICAIRADLDELEVLRDYGNRFHHDTNPAWRTAVINDLELLDFCTRTLAFTRR